MNNLPENENKIIEDTAEEISTVFSDPTAHKNTAPKPKKNRLIIALASILAVAIFAGGTVAVIKLIPEKEEEVVNPYLEETTVKEIKSDDIETLTVTDKNGTIELYSKSQKDIESSSSESYKWYLKGVKKDFIDSSSCESFVTSFGTVSSIREIEKTAAECGLDKPTITAKAVLREGDDVTVKIGLVSPDNAGYYCSLSGDEKIYLVPTSYVDGLKAEALDFAVSDTTAAFKAPEDSEDYLSDEGTIIGFDNLTVKSSKFDEVLEFGTNSAEELAQYAGYVVKSPSKRIAQNVEHVLAMFQAGLATTGAYSFDVTDASLKKVGLDKPDFEATLKIKNVTQTYKLALQDDGNYAVVCDQSKLIAKVSADTVASFIDFGLTDYYSSWICLYSIDDLKSVDFTVDGKKYTFQITANEDEESEDSYIITHNGKELDCQSFQNLYQLCISMACTDFTVDNLSEKPSVIFSFNFKNGENSVVEFTKFGETRYQYTIDGMPTGKTNSASISKFVKYLEKYAAGEILGDIN